MARRSLILVVILTFTCVGLYGFRLQILPWAARVLDVGVAPQKVDVVMALPGDVERRPFVAAAMVNTGLADRVLIPKNAKSPEVLDGLRPPNSEVARRLYEARGIAADHIILLEGATESTFDDLELLARHLDRDPDATAAVVTNAFHTRRTLWSLQASFPEHASRIAVISAPNSDFATETWWRSELGFTSIIFEHLKIIFYWIRYGTGVYWIVGVVIVGIGITVRRSVASQKRTGTVAVRVIK